MARTKIEGLPIQKEWKVLDVREGKEVPSDHGGTLKAFYVDFEGAPDVYWRRKMPATVEVGKTYFGTISDDGKGPKFKKESPEGGRSGGGGGGGSRGGGREWKPESQYDPEKTARIARSHAQGMALQWLGLADDEIPPTLDQLTPIIDWFEEDVQKAASKAKASAPAAAASPPPAGSPASQRPAPAPGNPDEEGDERDKFRALLEGKALAPYPAGVLADWIMKLAPGDRSRAWNGLGQFDTEMETLKELEEGYKNSEGEPLPTTPGSAEDDIPF